MVSLGPYPDMANPAFDYYEVRDELKSRDGLFTMQYDQKIPQLTSKDSSAHKINMQIQDKYHQLLENTIQEMDHNLEYYNDSSAAGKVPVLARYLYNADYQITDMNDHYLSMLIDEYKFAGGAHGMSERNALIFDMETGEEVKGAALFRVAPEILHQKKVAAFDRLFKENPANYWANASQIVAQTPDDFEKGYYLTKDGVVFYYPLYELAPYAGGFIEALVPYEQIPLRNLSA